METAPTETARERRQRPGAGPGARRRWSDEPGVAAAMERAQLRVSALLGGLRQDAGWSQQATATAAGVHHDTVQRIEKTTTDPQLSCLVRIAFALGAELEISLRPRR